MTGCTAAELGADLATYVVDRIERLERAHLRGFRVPRVFGGHPVAPDVRADLAFTLSHLRRCGVSEVAGVEVEDAIWRVLVPIDGAGTHTFFSYRVAEVLCELGGIDAVAAEHRTNLLAACDSTGHIPLLDEGRLGPNYAAVLLRCEVGRRRLGVEVAPLVLEDLQARVIALLDRPGGYLDDSNLSAGRYDIYSADIYLFTAPLADLLGEVWGRGAASALDLVGRVGATNGAGVHWGRSTGALAACLTVELAGLAAAHPALGEDVPAWLGRGANAFHHARRWFSGSGLVTAHQRRSTYGYRGPHRRLQMTLDCLGKLADTAALLAAAPPSGEAVTDHERLFPPVDDVIAFDPGRRAGVWTYRSRDLALVLPVVGSTVNDYLPSPHNPGLFEVPVERDLPTGLPVAFVGGQRFVGAGLPALLEHAPGRLRLRYEAHVASRQLDVTTQTPRLQGSRDVTYEVAGRTLHVTERLRFDQPPDALALEVAEASGRPLRLDVESSAMYSRTVVDVSGLKEQRSFWGELERVHEVDIEPAPEVELRWSVTPSWRVLSTAASHPYSTTVLDPLVSSGDAVVRQASVERMIADGRISGWDLLHLHWPEWSFGPIDVDGHRRLAEALVGAGVRIVWTQHNLVPHDKDPRHEEAYQVWAEAAHGIVHHSEHGRAIVTTRYRFRPGAVHRVIPHPHFGHLHGAPAPRREYGPIRLGVVGAPRSEKDVQMVMDAVAASSRDDISLEVHCLGPDDVVPDDPRITAEPFERIPWEDHAPRLHRLDALVLPFAEEGMLTTGTVADAIGAGLPALVSTWRFLEEVLGPAGIPYGRTREDLTRTLDALDRPTLAAAAEASRGLQERHSPELVAAAHLELFEAVGTTRL